MEDKTIKKITSLLGCILGSVLGSGVSISFFTAGESNTPAELLVLLIIFFLISILYIIFILVLIKKRENVPIFTGTFSVAFLINFILVWCFISFK